MIRFRLEAADLAQVRFAYGPLVEPVMSVRALADPGRHALHLPRVAEARPALSGLDLELLFALAGAEGLFGELHPRVRWRPGVLEVDKRCVHDRADGGEGVLMMPSVFGWPDVFVIADEPWRPSIMYPARAGVVDRTRVGRRVYYALNGRGRSVLELLDGAPA